MTQKTDIERTSSGVPDLDKFIEGGFPKGSVTLITGGPGSGKTTFCIQYLNEGIKKGEKCLYITTGQRPEAIRETAADFDIDFSEENENLALAHVSPSNNVAADIQEKIMDEDFDRIVLDSLSVFEMHWGTNDRLRKYINKLMEHFRDIGATVVVTSERPESNTGKLSRFGIAEFIVDGVIRLEGYALGETTYRSAQIVKMRRTDIDGALMSVNIDRNGLSVNPEEKL